MKKAILYLLSAAALIAFLTGGCSSSETVKPDKQKSLNTLSFYTEDDKYFEAAFDKENKITSLSIDGKEIPGSDYKLYQDEINNKLEDLRGNRDYTYNYKFDPHGTIVLNDDSVFTRHFKHFTFDDSTFKDQMTDLNKRLSQMKGMKFKMNFDKEKFREEMKQLHRKLSETNIEEELRGLNIEIKRMTKELKDKNFQLEDVEVDIPDIEIEINGLDKKLEGLDKEMDNVRDELKKLDSFMTDLKKQLVSDGIIKSADEDFSMNLNADRMKINDKEIPKDKFPRYKELYKKHFGKELTGDQQFEITN